MSAKEFPAVGNRNYSSGGLGNQGVNGNCWASTQYDGEKGYFMNFNSSGVNPSNYNYKSYGLSVRCVRREFALPRMKRNARGEWRGSGGKPFTVTTS